MAQHTPNQRCNLGLTAVKADQTIAGVSKTRVREVSISSEKGHAPK